MKAPNYFPVSTTHYSTTLSINIRRTKGWQGYGMYMAIQQILASTADRKLSIDEVPEIAFQLRLTVTEVQNIISSYYIIEDGFFYSPELEEALSYFDAKYNKASLAGKKSSEALTPEERKLKASNASKARWHKNRNSHPIELEKDANTSAIVSIDAKNSRQNANNKIEENIIGVKKMEEIKTEIKTEINDMEVNHIKENLIEPGFSLSPTEIQNSIDDYLSKSSNFFSGDNINVVVNTYTDYYKQYPSSDLSISKFEQILYYQLLGITMSKDVNDLNNYISTHPITIQPADVHNTNRIIGENTNIKDGFNKIIGEVYANINDNVN